MKHGYTLALFLPDPISSGQIVMNKTTRFIQPNHLAEQAGATVESMEKTGKSVASTMTTKKVW